MLSFLTTGEADIAAFDWTYNAERDEVVDLLYEWSETGQSVLIPVDEKEAAIHRLSLDLLFKNSLTTWMMTIAFAVGIPLVYMVGTCMQQPFTKLNLRCIDVVCLIFYRKFIGQCKSNS